MKKVLILLLGVIFFGSSCEKGEKFNLRPENVVIVSEDLSIENGILKFKSKESYTKILDKIKTNPNELNDLRKLLIKNGFESLETFYSNLDEKTINSILETQVIPAHLKNYLKINPVNDMEFELIETVTGSWLKLILNKNFNFAIGEGLLTIDGSEVVLIDNYKNPSSTKFKYKIMSNSDLKNLRAIKSSSNDNDYETGGRNYRLKININTPSSVYLAQWGFRVFFRDYRS